MKELVNFVEFCLSIGTINRRDGAPTALRPYVSSECAAMHMNSTGLIDVVCVIFVFQYFHNQDVRESLLKTYVLVVRPHVSANLG